MEQKKATVRGLGFLAFLLCVILDQVSKYLVRHHLKGRAPVILIRNVFQLQYLENRGAAFGLFQGGRFVFIPLTILIMAVIVYCYWRAPYERRFVRLRGIMVLVAAGAVGNFIDRMIFGYVTDFFYFILIDFPIFNVADIYVTCAAVFLVLLVLFGSTDQDWNDLLKSLGLKKEKKAQKNG